MTGSSEEEVSIVNLPKGLLAPISAQGPIEIEVAPPGCDPYTLTLGGVGPQSGAENQKFPCLEFRHVALLIRALESIEFNEPRIALSYRALLTHDGDHHRRTLRKTLSELAQCWMHIRQNGVTTTAKMIDLELEVGYKEGVDPSNYAEISKEESIGYRRLRALRMHDKLFRAFKIPGGTWPVRADVIRLFYSDIAGAAYLKLAPLAYHPGISEKNKGSYDAARLLRELGAEVPKYPSQLKQIFERERSKSLGTLLSQLNRPTWKDYLRVDGKLEKQKNGPGYNVRFWLDRGGPCIGTTTELENLGTLRAIWQRDAGNSAEDFLTAQRSGCREILSDEEEIIRESGYNLDDGRAYLELIRSFIGPTEFFSAIAETKSAAKEQRINTSPERYLGGILREKFREFAGKYCQNQKTQLHRNH